MSPRYRGPQPQNFAKGTQLQPDSYRGLSGARSGSQGRLWAPFGVKYGNGSSVVSFYDHYYRTEREHYHVSHEDLVKCQELYP